MRFSETASLGPHVQAPPGEVRLARSSAWSGLNWMPRTNRGPWIDLGRGVPCWESRITTSIHAVDVVDQMVAQRDGPLAQPSGVGELARQRIHLALPKGASQVVDLDVCGHLSAVDGVGEDC